MQNRDGHAAEARGASAHVSGVTDEETHPTEGTMWLGLVAGARLAFLGLRFMADGLNSGS